MTFAELEKILKKHGWYYYSAIGFHFQYANNTQNGIITIPKYRGDTVNPHTLHAILQQAGIQYA